jgi:ribonuclease BN (tRNA processing enzyme)
MTIRVVPLGINGFFPSFGRHTMSVLVLNGSEAFLFDAGTGVARLQEPQIADMLHPYRYLNVILSHYHLDHIVGLPYLSSVWKQGTVRLYAPGRPFVEVDPVQTLNRFLAPPYFPVSLKNFPVPIEVIPVRDPLLNIGASSVRFRSQNHPGGSTGIRLDNTVAYVTDTTVEAAARTFLKDVRLLMHEVFLTDREAKADEVEASRHSYPSAVAKLARDASVANLMPIHHNPKRSDDEMRQLIEDIRNVAEMDVWIPEEGRIYEVNGSALPSPLLSR